MKGSERETEGGGGEGRGHVVWVGRSGIYWGCLHALQADLGRGLALTKS